MMKVVDFLAGLSDEIGRRPYFIKFEILEHSSNLIKARLIISNTLFVQIYRNDQYNTTNLALIHNASRIYARDQLGGVWHRHGYNNPEAHDTSSEGRKPVALAEFLDEVEALLAQLKLP